MHVDSLRHLYTIPIRKSVLRAPILEAQFWADFIDSTQALQHFNVPVSASVRR